jgi:hypothetical protein
LDDIAREVGGRAIKQEVSGPDGGKILVKIVDGVSYDNL